MKVSSAKRSRLVLIVNTHSRKGERLFFRALDLLQMKGIDVVASYPVRKPERLRQVVMDVIEEGHPLIIVGGGDGTFNTITDLSSIVIRCLEFSLWARQIILPVRWAFPSRLKRQLMLSHPEESLMLIWGDK